MIEILVKGLKRLEYRGYDSAGVGVLLEDKLDKVKIVKKLGKVSNLKQRRQKSSYVLQHIFRV